MTTTKLFSILKKSILHIIIHGIVLFCTLWLSGAFVALINQDYNVIDANLYPINYLYQWVVWLVKARKQLTIDQYNYLQLKLIVAISIAPVSVCIYYIKNFKNIKEFRFQKKAEELYGSASWASEADIERAQLRSEHGMMLGTDDAGYYVADGFEHALIFAPTGSGKGVGFVIPNLLFWQHSILVHDIKLENFQLTSGWRKSQGQEVFVWEPSNPDGITHCYNPLDWISTKPGQMVDDIQKIANLIMPKKEFWTNEARSLFVGVVLYLVADDTKVQSFGEVVRTMRSDDVAHTLSIALDTLGEKLHPVAYMNIAAFLQKADKERSGVISTMNSELELWANPLIDKATASSDFNMMEFKRKKITVYVGLTPDNIQPLQKLMQVFYQQGIDFLSRKIPDKTEPYGVMFLLDEFPTLGKMDIVKTSIAYLRGYKVRLFLIVQDTQQLKGIYEESGMNSFLSNSKYRITFAANNYDTANFISQLCGTKTIDNVSYSKPSSGLGGSSSSKSISKVQRALLLPQEVLQMPPDEQIVLIESFPPIKSKKIKYYQDKNFTKKLLSPTFVPTQEAFTIKS